MSHSAMIRDMSNGHSETVFCVLCKKISTGWGNLAPIDWHYWHVFATLVMVDWAVYTFVVVLAIIGSDPKVPVSWPGGSRLVKEGQTLTINEDGSSRVG